MKADLYTAPARTVGTTGRAHRTAAGFAVLTSNDGDHLISLVDSKQHESDLIDQVVAAARDTMPSAFAMLFTAGGEMYVLASGAVQVGLASESTNLTLRPTAHQVLVHTLDAGVNETDAVVRLYLDGDAIGDGCDLDPDSETIAASGIELAVGDAVFDSFVPTAAQATNDATVPLRAADEGPHAAQDSAPEPAEAEAHDDSLTDARPEPPAAADIPFATEAESDSPTGAELAPAIATASAEATGAETAPDAEAAEIIDLAASEAAAAQDDEAEVAEAEAEAAPEIIDLAVSEAAAAQADVAEAEVAEPAPEIIDLAASEAAASQAAANQVVANQVVASPVPAAMAATPQATPAQAVSATPLATRASAAAAAVPAPAPSATVGPVMVLGVSCPNGHHNHPDAVFCSQCGTKMAAQPTTVLINGPRPPLGVLVVDDGTTYSLNEDLIIGREPTSHEDVMTGVASPMILSDDTLSMSRKHARIILDDWKVAVQDLDSSNGTYLSRAGQQEYWAKIISGSTMMLEPGDRLRVGGRIIQVELHHIR